MTSRPAPGVIAIGVGFGCALVSGIVIRDLSESTFLRLATPMVAACLGIVVAFKVLEARSRKP